MRENIVSLMYLVAAIGFALSLKWMSAPATARRGILAGELGFGLAIVATLLLPGYTSEGYVYIAVALLLGSAIGVPLGLMVPMTAMPQRIALSHAFGGLAAALVGTAHYYLQSSHLGKFDLAVLGVEIVLGFLVFTGSLMASGKLHELLPQRPILYPGQNNINFSILGVAAVLVVVLVFNPNAYWIVPLLGGAGAGLRRAADHPDRRAPTCRRSSPCSTPTPACRPRRWASCSTTSC